MDDRITHQHIANEAYRVYKITGREDNDANWQEAIENLKIFPRHKYNVAKVYNADQEVTDNEKVFGLIRPGFVERVMRWQHCREVFERDIFIPYSSYHGNFRFGFFLLPTTTNQERWIAEFIRDIELKRLHLDELTTFMRVANKRYIYVRPSSFWTDCQIRFSLLTILLRAGRYYTLLRNGRLRTIESTLSLEPYSLVTMPAINAFFNGRRRFTGQMANWRCRWVEQFEDLEEEEITTLQ